MFASLQLILLVATCFTRAQKPESSKVGQPDGSAQIGYKYAVVVDCGSSGTRAHIYRWPRDATGSQLADLLEPLKDETGEKLSKRLRPGLASFRDQPEVASDYMRPIMDFISVHVPVDNQRETPVYFMGTAGLRLLTKEEQSSILEDIVRDLSREYNFPLLNTKVISGAQEGLYQWLSINAFSGRTNARYDMINLLGKNFYCQAPRSRRFAMLEMGGASAQVAFELVPELDRLVRNSLRNNYAALEAYENNQLLLNVEPNKQVRVLSLTFLGLGSNSARDLAIDLLVRDSVFTWRGGIPPASLLEGRQLQLDDPCLPRGGQEVAVKPVQLLIDANQNLGFVSKPGEPSFTVSLFGTGNLKKCHLLLIRMTKLVKRERLNCDKQQQAGCSTSLIGTNFLPYNQFQYLGLSELFYTTDEMMHASGSFNTARVVRRTFEICSTPYEILMQQYPEATRNDPSRILFECFKATWILTWLQYVINMPMNNVVDLTTVGEINGNDIDWTLGALIGQMFEQQP